MRKVKSEAELNAKNAHPAETNCQAKVKTKSKVKSNLQRSKDQKLLWTFAYCIVISPHHPTHPTHPKLFRHL